MYRERVLPADKGPNMPQYFPYSTQYYSGEPHVQNQESNYSVNVTYRPTSSPAPNTGTGLGGPNSNPANGYAVNPDNPSPNSSQLSVHSGDVGHPQLISRTTTRNSTQQVTTVTKVIKSRELRHIGPDGQPLDYDPSVTYGSTQPPPPPPSDYTTYGYSGMTDPASRSDYGTYDSGRPPSPGGQEPPPGQDYLHYVGRPHSPSSEASSRRNYDSYPSPHRTSYQDYDPHLHPPPPPAGQARSPPPVDYAVYHLHQDGPPPGGYQGGYGSGVSGSTGGNGLVGSGGNYSDLVDRPPTPPSPTSDASASPLPQRAMPQAPGPQGPAPYPLSGYEELDNTLVLARPPRNSDLYDPYGSHTPHHGGPYGTPAYFDHHKPSTNANTYADHPSSALYEDEEFPSDDQQPQSDVRWRDPDLSEVVEFLQHPNNVVKANAAAYLQHLCFNEDDVKQKVRSLGGIPPLISMLSHEIPEVHRNACGALRNLSYGRQNDENKRAIKNAGGVPALIRLLRKTPDNEVRELVTGILWNLSSCEELKKPIIDDGLTVITNVVIIPHSGWDRNLDPSEGLKNAEIYWSTVFRNASGVLRNVSSAGEYARRKLRECDGLVDALLHLVKAAIGKNDIDNKSVENCVCVLRNLSYRCQEVDDPNYDRHEQVAPQMKAGFPAGDNLGCFGGSKKKKEAQNVEKQRKETTGTSASPRPRSEPVKGMELLWQPEVVHVYLALLSDCSNPETLEAAAGAIQNLAACYWQASIDIRAAVRKEKGLPVLVELLRMEVDRVVCAVATALRNLALDQRNKELIGKYAMKDLVQKLPSESQHHETGTSDDTYTAVLATLNEVIKKNAEFARSLLETGGIDRLMYITRQRSRFSVKVTKFASQVLFNLWQHQELREAYKKQGWKENNFVTRTMAARSLSPSNANSTLNRPISSQGGTKYEDKTLQRSREVNSASAAAMRTPENPIYNRQPSEEVPLTEMPYTGEPTHRPPVGGVQVFPPGLQHLPRSPNEPVYAQVNREKKKLRQYDEGQSYQGGANEAWNYERQQQQQHLLMDGQEEGQQGGDSWV